MNEQNYRIGLTTQITGIRPETLRAWERRYSVVKPIRTEAGDRLYTQADIDRLLLIKRLVDNGDAISAVANLSHDTLKERIDNCRTAIASDKKGKLAFVLLGSTILDKNTLDQMNLNMIDVKTDASELKSNYHAKVNFVIVEMQSVHPGSLDYIQSIKKITKAEKILVAYDFGREADVALLNTIDSSAIKLPLKKDSITDWCQENFPSYRSADSSFMPRVLSSEQINTIIKAGSNINCECPQHLSEIIGKLVAFEKYSSQCEARNPQDAEIHTLLEEETSKCRHAFEKLLVAVANFENIEY